MRIHADDVLSMLLMDALEGHAVVRVQRFYLLRVWRKDLKWKDGVLMLGDHVRVNDAIENLIKKYPEWREKR